jgi:hypothetical protein
MNTKKLLEEIRRRSFNREKIRNSINEYCFREYGIYDFFTIADQYLKVSSSENIFKICLARQVPCQNVEHLAINRLASFLTDNGIYSTAMPMAFVRDSYTSTNEYKSSLAKIPHLYRSRKGTLIIKKENILAHHHRENVDGKILDRLETQHGMPLVDFHYALRRNIFGQKDVFVDFSSFVKEIARQSVANGSKNMPEFVFIRSGIKEKKVHPHEADFSNGQDPRPPADWYYFLYLMLFLDGSCALASTVDEDPRVISWFTSNIAKIEGICGFRPLFIDTPLKVSVEELSSKLNEFPKWVSEDAEWESRISLSELSNHKLYQIVEEIEKKIISLA